MQDTELFLSLAEIAGVLVGFGALIAVRNSATMEVGEINGIRWVMTTGIWVVIVALAPTIIMIWVLAWTPENQAELDRNLATVPRAKIALVVVPTFWLPVALVVIALALVVLGLFPDQEQALYLTAVALGLYMGALALFVAVFWRPSVPADRAGPAAPGGLSA